MKRLISGWNEFFFRPQSPVPIAVFRIFYGVLIFIDLLLLKRDWLAWFGPRGWVTPQTMHLIEPGTRINIFSLLPQTDLAVEVFFWFFLVFSLFLTLGLFTRLSTVVVFVCLCSMHERLLLILHAGDTLLRTAGFFLIFAPAGAALSADRLLRIWNGKEGLTIEPRSPWAQRLIQCQVALVYFATFWWKSAGQSWVNGTALYYIFHLDEFRRFPLPDLVETALTTKLATWLTLAVEFAMGVLVWFKELRYYVLLVGVLLHFSLEYSMNIPLFQWIMLSTYVTFIDPADLARFGQWIRKQAAKRVGTLYKITYDPRSERAVRAMNVLRTVDIFNCIDIVESNVPESKVLTASAGAERPSSTI